VCEGCERTSELWVYWVCLKTADLHRTPQTSADHPRTVRKTAGHTAEHSGVAAKPQNNTVCVFFGVLTFVK